MSSSLSPLNLSAAALTVLQNRSLGGVSAVKATLDGQRQPADLAGQASETLAQKASTGTPIPRGQILNILV
jgi:hypothetical protein